MKTTEKKTATVLCKIEGENFTNFKQIKEEFAQKGYPNVKASTIIEIALKIAANNLQCIKPFSEMIEV